MPDLIAQGPEAQQRWRRMLPEGEPIVLGRLGGVWAVPWDQQVSRRHVRLLWDGSRLEVARLADARNPLFLHGQEVDRCTLAPGEHFVIGQTTFTLADQQVNVTADAPEPVQQQSFSAQYLKQVQFRNPDHRIEVLEPAAGRDFRGHGRSGAFCQVGQYAFGGRAPGRRRRGRGR